jgi:hypothetical protein
MATLTRHTTNHLAAQLCSGLTSVATNRDTESGINYIGPLYKMATLTRHTTNHLAAQLCSGLSPQTATQKVASAMSDLLF